MKPAYDDGSTGRNAPGAWDAWKSDREIVEVRDTANADAWTDGRYDVQLPRG
jgi:hypothetical protein